MADTQTDFKWTFQRLGGLDQVVLRGAEDLCRLRELDPKLWVALSCPASGLQFDARTLALIDADKDGRVRIPEIVDAVEWSCARLKNPGLIKDAPEGLRVADIDDSTDDGKRVSLTARAILKSLGKGEDDFLTRENVVQAASHASEQMFNGDGILPPQDGFDSEVRRFISDALAVTGGVEDAGGEIGVNREIVDAFMTTLRGWLDWHQSVREASTPLGADTQEAWELQCALRDKIDDYFLRCELAAYAPAARDALSVDEKLIAPAEGGILETSLLAELPLSGVEPDSPLNLRSGLNPAWREKVERFAELVKPLLTAPGFLSRDDWRNITERFEPYAKAVSQKPAPPATDATASPTSTVEKLGEERIREILDSDIRDRFDKLAEEDADVPAAAADIAKVERLVIFCRHLYRLLVNFVNFEEFYALRRSAAFQAGMLYIDGRSCHLCMPADNVESHSALAANSQLYLLYCSCTRGRKPGEKEPEKTINVVAAVTAGDSDLLMQSRNGIYVDNNGDDWDATVVKIIANPIGLWQALWSPYKRFGSMVTEQISKFANQKQDELMSSAGKKLGLAANQVTTVQPVAPPRFDIGRNVGIFAAVGLALGAIGTAVGSIVNALFGMSWWQFPLLLGGLFLVISGPSLLMAWLKLRQRTLGPLLEASGWAINGRVTINYALSRCLTNTAVLPPNSRRSRDDPFARRRRRQRNTLLAAMLVGAAAAFGWLWFRGAEPEAETVAETVVEDVTEPGAKVSEFFQGLAEQLDPSLAEKRAEEQQKAEQEKKAEEPKAEETKEEPKEEPVAPKDEAAPAGD